MAEDQRIDSARLDSDDRPGRDGQGEKEAARFTSPISPSISQSSIVNHQPTSSLYTVRNCYTSSPSPSPKAPASVPARVKKHRLYQAWRVILCWCAVQDWTVLDGRVRTRMAGCALDRVCTAHDMRERKGLLRHRHKAQTQTRKERQEGEQKSPPREESEGPTP